MDQSAREIICDLLNVESDNPSITQQHEDDPAPPVELTRERNRKRTERGHEFWLETLKHNRDSAHKRISRKIERINSSVERVEETETLVREIEDLDSLKEELNQAFLDFHHLMESEEDKVSSYRWFDLIEREFNDCRLRISSRIQAIEKGYPKAPSVRALSQANSRETKSSHSSSSSVRSRKVKAAAKAARLEAEIKFLNEEADLKRVTMMKELAVAKAELEAMRNLEEEDYANILKQEHSSDRHLPSKLDQNAPPFIPTSAHLQTPPEQFRLPVKPEPGREGSFDHSNFRASPFMPKMTQPQNKNPITPSISEIAIQEMLKLQAKQTELSALIAEQQRVIALPTQEPPIFNGNYFDFPIFMRAFETIIESRVTADKERLYFLNKYTEGKANEIVKSFVTLSASDSYQRAKKLLVHRFGDPHRVSDAYKSRLRKWPQINDGQSTELQALSDFLTQCEEAMKTVKSLKDLDSSEVLRLVSSKLPPYLGVKWCRHAFELKRNRGHMVSFHDIVRFVEVEADLATDPVFSPDVLKAERKKTSDGGRNFGNRRRPPQSSVLATSTGDSKRNQTPRPGRQALPRSCLLCSKDHSLSSCDELKSKNIIERRDFVQSAGLCFGCLGKGHYSKNCNQRLTCQKCRKSHPTILHYDAKNDKEPRDRVKEKEHENEDQGEVPSVCRHTVGERACVTNSMIVPVWLYHKDSPHKEVLVYALLDEASDTTFIASKTLRDLGLKGPEITLNLHTMLGKEEVQVERINGLVAQRLDKRVEVELPRTYSRTGIPYRRNQVPTPEVASKWTHLKKMADKLHPYQSNIDVGLLIGCNCPRAIKPREVILGRGEDPYAVRTLLGWGIIGPVTPCQDEKEDVEVDKFATCNRITSWEVGNDAPSNLQFIPVVHSKEEINPCDVRKMFEMDFSEKTLESQALSKEDRKFLAIVEEGIRHCEDSHYELPLPLRATSPHLPNNRETVLRRLRHLQRRFASDKKYKEDYTLFMEKMLANGYAEEVAPLETGNDGKKVWYIPHHGVYHPKKPTKIRVVFDCSAEFKNHSLNKHLLQGPDLTNNLVGVLSRFRQEPIAVMCDIESMFFQVRVSKEFRYLLRFLWWKDGDITKQPTEFRMTVHLFGATSSPGCANFALKTSANDNEEELGHAAANFVRRDFYVDDGLKSVKSVAEAVNLIEDTKELCRRGGFKLHKFVSNCKDVIDAIPPEDRAEGIQKIDLNKEALPIERALGVEWCIENDLFQFKIVLKDRPCTRRGILSTVSSIYDPLGFAAPLLLEGKKILQELCRSKADWDDPVPEEIKAKWIKWRVELPLLEELRIPRCYKPADFGLITSVQLHHFSDASTLGYGQCSYLRFKNDKDQIHCSFVMGKARVAPLKPITIPRLELTAAVVSVKLSAQLQRELEFEGPKEIFWTDSQVVLGYISNETRRFHVYVANRVQQIQDHSSPDQWRHVDTKRNPADLASRGLTPLELVKSNWITGPEFLWKDESHWPSMVPCVKLSQDDPEVKKAVSLVSSAEEPFPSLASRMEYFSDLRRAKRAVAHCLLYMKMLKEKAKSKSLVWCEQPRQKGSQPTSISQVTSEHVSVEVMLQAEFRIIKSVQGAHFDEEIKALTSKSKLSSSSKVITIKKSSPLFKLDPFLDTNGLLRVGGRLRNAKVPESVKFPVILPGKNHLSQLIIKQCHEEVNHQGKGITLSEVRSRGYWIVGGSSVISSHIANCALCRKLRGVVQEQKMADLPVDRLEPAPPFTYCGVDYFGPWTIKEGRREMKRYGVLFTCMVSRAIHLESANSLDTSSFINAYRRFVCRRGPVRQLRSDQGSNFIGARRELSEALKEFDHDKVKSELLKTNCDWIRFKMNAPSASHMGGIWERQIRTVRSVMSALLEANGAQLDDEALRTFLCEAEAIVNSRPLSVQNLSDPSLEPLTPNQLLTTKSKVVLPPPGMFEPPDLYSRKRWRRIQHLANEFWSRWRKEFLLSLQQRCKWNRPRRNLSTNDIVIIKDETLPRNSWRLARVSKANQGKDGHVRTVEVAVGEPALSADGRRPGPIKYLDRPIHKLILLLSSDTPAGQDQG